MVEGGLHSRSDTDDCWSRLASQHALTLDFCATHFLRINTAKSSAVVASGSITSHHSLPPSAVGSRSTCHCGQRGGGSSCDGNGCGDPDSQGGPRGHCVPRTLPGLDPRLIYDPGCSASDSPPSPECQPGTQVSPLVATGPDAPGRYLGIFPSILADDSAILDQLRGRVFGAATHIRRANLGLLQSGLILKEFVYPRLESCLLFSRPSADLLRMLQSVLLGAVFRSDRGMHIAKGMSHSAFLAAIGIPTLAAYARTLRYKELVRCLSFGGTPAHATTWARVISACTRGSGPERTQPCLRLSAAMADGCPLQVVTGSADAPGNRAARILLSGLLEGGGIHLTWANDSPVDYIQMRVPEVPDPELLDPALLPPSVLGFPIHPAPTDARGSSLVAPIKHSPNEPPPAVVAFTDGSFREGVDGSPPGCGAGIVLCLQSLYEEPDFCPDPTNCVRLAFPAPPTCRNYSAEVWAHVLVAAALPVDVSVSIYTDAESAQRHWKQGALPIGQLLRAGARSLFALGRRILAVRERHGAECLFHWVRAHTGEATLTAQLNAAADEEAARGAQRGTIPMVLTAELPALFFTADPGSAPLAERLHHISGCVGSLFAANERLSLLSSWEGRSQGVLLRAARSQILTFLRLVRRGRHPYLFDFLLQMLVRQTPTPDRVTYGCAARSARTISCPLCCGHPGSAHILRCRVVSAERNLVLADAGAALRRLVQSSATSGFHPDGGKSLSLSLLHIRFFDPGVGSPPGPLPSDVLGGRVSPHWAARVDAIHGANRELGFLGVLPAGFRSLIVPRAPRDPSRLPEHRTLTRSLDGDIAELQMLLLRGAWSVFLAYMRRVTGCASLSPQTALGSLLVQNSIQALSGAMHSPRRSVHFERNAPGDGRGRARPPFQPMARVALSTLAGHNLSPDELQLLQRRLEGPHLGRRRARLSDASAALRRRALMPRIPSASYKRRKPGPPSSPI